MEWSTAVEIEERGEVVLSNWDEEGKGGILASR